MRQARHHARFQQKLVAVQFVGGQLRVEHFQRDQPIEPALARQKHEAHPSPAERGLDVVNAGQYSVQFSHTEAGYPSLGSQVHGG